MPHAMNVNRRTFLQTAAGLAAAAARAAPVAPGPARIIDTHTHFFDPARPQGVPWPPKDDELLYRPTLPRDYRALPVPQPVTGTVVVEASPWVEDNQWILDLAARDPFIVGFVGNLLPGRPEFAGHLKRFAANPLFRGIRFRDGSLEKLLEDPAFIADLRALADRGLTFDVHSPPSWAGQAGRIAKMVPDLRLIINHAGHADVNGRAPPEAWREWVRTLAGHPQIYLKVSGLVEGTKRTGGDAPELPELYRPALEILWQAFGADRLLYASNWPVSGRFAPLGRVQRIAMEFFAAKGQAALDQVFWRNAQTAYGLKT